VKWIPPKWDWIDPLKDRQAEKLAVDNGWKSRDDVIEAEGYDPEETDARIRASQDRVEDLELQIEMPGGNAPSPFEEEEEDVTSPDDETDTDEEPKQIDEQKPPRRKNNGRPSSRSAHQAQHHAALVSSEPRRADSGSSDGRANRPIVLHNHPPSIHLDVHMPSSKGHRTKVLATDSNGRILETESTPIPEEEEN
jgi:hypothetical protein